MPHGDPRSIRCAYSPWRLQNPPTPLLNARALLQPSTAEAQSGPMPSKRGAARASSQQRSLCLHCPAGLRSWDPPPAPGTPPPSRPTLRSAPPPRDRPPPPQPACQPTARRRRIRSAAPTAQNSLRSSPFSALEGPAKPCASLAAQSPRILETSAWNYDVDELDFLDGPSG
ncbi:Unconventional Myosin-Ie [Manis pentadactyla]|nr:Unconventional Myosin-Ie [Manis pentadactyla]